MKIIILIIVINKAFTIENGLLMQVFNIAYPGSLARYFSLKPDKMLSMLEKSGVKFLQK